MRLFLGASLVLLVVLAVSVYRAKLGAQDARADVAAIEAEIAQIEDELSVLRAEEAHLSRPDRIGPMAREHLGLEPVAPHQFQAAEDLPQDPRVVSSEGAP